LSGHPPLSAPPLRRVWLFSGTAPIFLIYFNAGAVFVQAVFFQPFCKYSKITNQIKQLYLLLSLFCYLKAFGFAMNIDSTDVLALPAVLED
jgi:hypothetical protein